MTIYRLWKKVRVLGSVFMIYISWCIFVMILWIRLLWFYELGLVLVLGLVLGLGLAIYLLKVSISRVKNISFVVYIFRYYWNLLSIATLCLHKLFCILLLTERLATNGQNYNWLATNYSKINWLPTTDRRYFFKIIIFYWIFAFKGAVSEILCEFDRCHFRRRRNSHF